jgi:hypothetical protein
MEKKRSPLGTTQRRQYLLFYTITTIEYACSSVRNSEQEKRIKWASSDNMIDHELKLIQTLFDTYCITKQIDDQCIVKNLSIYECYEERKRRNPIVSLACKQSNR